MGEFSYKGVDIHITNAGHFNATVGGEFVSKSSLSALRKYIDEVGVDDFKPFRALMDDRWNNQIKEVEVVGLVRTKNRRHGDLFKFAIKGTDNVTSGVIEDTKANKKLLADLSAYKEETERIDYERLTHTRELEEKITKVIADDLAKKMGRAK